MVKTWTEVQDTFLTDVSPMDPDGKPTAIYLFAFSCRRTKRGVSRKITLQTLEICEPQSLAQRLMEFMESPSVLPIKDQDFPLKYAAGRGEPDMAETANPR